MQTRRCMSSLVRFALVVTILVLGFLPAMAVDIGPMTWTPRPDWLNVKTANTLTGAGNAVGDGVTDDTAAIQAAFNYILVRSNGYYRTIYFPPGTYKISSTLTWDGTLYGLYNMSIIGSGSNTIIQWAGPTGAAMFHPQHTAAIRYLGLVWDGENSAGCGIEQFSSDGFYDGNIRHENESFRNFTQQGTYATGHSPLPGAGIAGGFIVSGVGSLAADSMVYNCRFYNCSTGFFNNVDFGNNMEWLFDGCEFDNCGIGINFNAGGCNTVANTHFQNSTTADVQAFFGIRMRHCTSQGSNCLYYGVPNSYGPNVYEDCWVDGWTNTSFAIGLGSEGGDMIFDCTFTNPPSGAAGAIASYEGWTGNNGAYSTQQLVLSNNYAQGFANGMGLINGGGTSIEPLTVPRGTRFTPITSAAQTFLNSAAFVDSTHIIDVTQAPYYANSTYSGDASPAIQAAINAAISANNGTVVYFPTGLYQLYEPLTASGGNYTLQGSYRASEFCWMGADNSTMLTISNPASVLVDGIRFAALDNTITGISQTGTSTSNVTYREVGFNSFQTGNPGAGGPDISNAPGLVLSNLPSGAKVYLDHDEVPLTVSNSASAQVLGRFLQNGAVNVNGTAAKTGFLGFLFSEGGNYANLSQYNLTVNDNNDFIIVDDYTERAANDLQCLRGSGTGTGRVTIQGWNVAPWNYATMVNVNNYAGRLFMAPQLYFDDNQPAIITQTGSNPVDMIFTAVAFGSGVPALTLDTGANLLLEDCQEINSNQTYYFNNTPSNPSGTNMISIAAGIDHVRDFSALDESTRYGLSTDGPPLVSYSFENDCTDQMGNANGTNHGVTYGDGMVGYNGARLNGVNEYVDLHNPAVLPTGHAARSICGWGRTDSLAGGWAWIASFGSPGTDLAMFIGRNGNTLYGGGYADDLSVPNFWDDKWHFIVLTYDGTTAKLYADGALVASGAKNWNLASGYAYVGKQVNGGEYWDGDVDQVEIYNYALSAADVASMYNHDRVAAPLASRWKLDETSGSTSADWSGNGATGTWENGPTPSTDHPAFLTSATGSLSFNASSSQDMTMGNPRNLPIGRATRTLCGWAKNSGTPNGYHMLASMGSPNNDQGFWIGANGTSLSAGSWGDDMPNVPNFWDNNWHFICLTYDGQNANLYADGALLETAAKPWSLVPDTCYIGCYMNHQGFWNGNVCDVRVYNRALTPTEIQKMAGVYDLADDFETTSDSGTNRWTYGTYTSAGNPSTFSIPASLSFSNILDGLNIWFFPPAGLTVDPNIEKNNSANPIMGSGIEFDPGKVSFGPYQGPAVARFTAPKTGHYNISATFQTDQIRGSTSDGTTAYVNVGTSHVYTQALSDPGAAQFGTPETYTATNVSLSAGQTVDFVVGNGAFTTQVDADLSFVGP